MSPRVSRRTVETSPVVHNSSEPQSSSNSSTTIKVKPKPIFIVKSRNSIDASAPIQYEIVEVNSAELSCDINLDEQTDTKLKSQNCSKTSTDSNISCKQRQSLVTSFFSEFNPNKSQEEQTHCKNLKKTKFTEEYNKYCSKKARKIVKKYLPINRKNGVKRMLLKKLYRIANCFKEKEFNNIHLLAVHNSIQTLNIYMTLVEFNIKMANSVKRTSKEGGDDLNRRTKVVDEVAVDQQEINNPGCHTSVNVVTKRNSKAQRSDNTRLMLLPEAKDDINEKDLGE